MPMIPPASERDARRLIQKNKPTRMISGKKPARTVKKLVPVVVPFTFTSCCSRSAASVLSFNAVGMRDW